MPNKGNRKRLKFRAEDVCSESVTVADYANADPAIVKSGRVKKAVVNAIEKEVKLLCGLEASQGPVQEVLSSAVGVSNAALESSDELDSEEGDEIKGSRKKKNKRRKGNCRVLQLPRQYKDVHTNPDSDCYLLRVTTLNFIFTSVVMGMTLTLFTINVSTDMRHHRVRLEFQDSPVIRGKKLRGEQGVQVVLDPVHSVRLMDWWHPQYPTSSYN
ncbi:transmembrane protein 183-like [Sinocyclocheilus grahami]|uniref:transmembrane protein 183-like n=1 Tax=Sinocyclocheilus grahami TaxID=75366 RepID=UPI0007ACD50E|nr:PREDICTED: transmembrane protein 183-like [Sinocyclocheilus grahami]